MSVSLRVMRQYSFVDTKTPLCVLQDKWVPHIVGKSITRKVVDVSSTMSLKTK